MFESATSFNVDLSKWNVAKGERFRSMFNGATSFNADLSKWKVWNIYWFSNAFTDAGCTTPNCGLVSP